MSESVAERQLKDVVGSPSSLESQDPFQCRWGDLSLEHQAAAAILGGNDQTWARLTDANHAWPAWENFSALEREAAAALGRTETSWPPEGTMPSAVESLQVNEVAAGPEEEFCPPGSPSNRSDDFAGATSLNSVTDAGDCNDD
eukprot:SAG31_NODE_19321_length_606_cov_0.798817_1_plen_142_part_01